MDRPDAMPGSSRLVASFAATTSARGAMLDLESLGIDAAAINLLDRQPATEGDIDRSGELEAGQHVARNYAVGAVLLGLAVAAVVVAVILIAGVRPRVPAAVGGGIAGFIAGFVLGGFWNAARKLPVNVDALDTFSMDSDEHNPVKVEVRLDDGALADRAEAVCRDHDALEVERLF